MEENVRRGFIDTLQPCVVNGTAGNSVWNADAYDFLKGSPPTTVNKKLWEHSKLNAIHGLFEVVPGIYQVRGLDISNMTILEGQSGVIIVDPLTSTECAAAALSLYRGHRGDRPVKAIIYSHSHADHYGGALGVVTKDTQAAIIAPSGFMEEAMSENIFAGPAMLRRAGFMYGTPLPNSAVGQVNVGIGMAVSSGSRPMLPPNKLIEETGQELVVDGLKIVFQMVPGTEAPAELNFYLPAQKALYISECATHSLHNIITLRGAQVRDAKAWSKYLDETMELYGAESDVLFAGHHWPTWGTANIMQHVADHRDLFAYLHDQTLRLTNLGLNGTEVAEKLTLPPRLRDAPHLQGFYGSVSHNVKGIYQRYMSWFDGNPAHLWQHPPAAEGARYAECFGGVKEMVKKAEAYAKAGDLRFAATLLDHAVKADPSDADAKQALASVFERLGYGSENATWRNFYLTGALQMRHAGSRGQLGMGAPLLNPLGTVDQWLDTLSIQIDGLAAAEENIKILLHGPELGKWLVSLSNGALTYQRTKKESAGSDSLALELTKDELFRVLNGDANLAKAKSRGSSEPLVKLLKLCSVEVRE